MAIRPLLSALLRNKTGPLLVALQIAIALAVIVNAFYVTMQRVESINKPSGLDVRNIFSVAVQGFAHDLNFSAMVQADLTLLSSMPGVIAVTTVSSIPLSGNSIGYPYYAQPEQKGKMQIGWVHGIDEQGIDALGVNLIAGKPFDAAIVARAGEAQIMIEALANLPPEIIVTDALAKSLFPNQSALGKTIYGPLDRPFRIVGIVDHMQGPYPGLPVNDQVALHPVVFPGPGVNYLVRTQPGRRDELMTKVESELMTSLPGRVIEKVEALEETARRTNAVTLPTTIMLILVIAAVLGVTALGIFGLATFNVTSRTKQIGTRRAIGARKFDIINYFLIENWIITTGGVVLGCVLALAIGIALSSLIFAPRLPLYYLIGGVLGLWILGLIATWVPARRAASVSPAVATRGI